MFNYVTNTTFAEIADRIRAAGHVALITHSKPDGDAVGSQLALRRALSALGKRVTLYAMGPIERSLITVAGETPMRQAEDDPPYDDHDLLLIVDTGAWSQLEPLAQWIRQRHDLAVVLDHHVHGDDVAALRIVDSNAAAAATLVIRLLDELGYELTGGVGSVAEALFFALATDTGWFRFANANADAFALAARLMEAGIDNSRLYQISEESFEPSRLAVEARALSSLEYALDGRAAFQFLRLEDLKETGASVEELTGLVNNPMSVGTVRISILLAETEPGRTKVSFRSKPPLDDGLWIDVNELAGQLNGGGHAHAAGARLPCGIDEAARIVRRTLEEL
ncbi:MAG: DHH family phosphoesterase [Phycisphaerales bacterium]|nr:MAG: DHH family phosphoesterase [Phycisphaerales bacterium]